MAARYRVTLRVRHAAQGPGRLGAPRQADAGRALPARAQGGAGAGQPQHARHRLAVCRLQPRRGVPALAAPRASFHAQARELAECCRD